MLEWQNKQECHPPLREGTRRAQAQIYLFWVRHLLREYYWGANRLWGQTQNQILLVSIFGLRIQFGDQKCRLSVTFVNGLWRETWIVF